MPAGRPKLFKSKAELEKKIKSYFEKEAFVTFGDVEMYSPTISGLAYHLGMSTETLRMYGQSEEFSATIKRAKQKVEIHLEQRLASNAATGTIFNLKNNFGWKDKQEIEHSGGLSDITEEEIDAKLAELEKLISS